MQGSYFQSFPAMRSGSKSSLSKRLLRGKRCLLIARMMVLVYVDILISVE